MTELLHFYYGGACGEAKWLAEIKKAEPELRLRVSLTLNLLHFQRIDNGFCISLRLLLIVGWQGNLQRQQMAVHFTQHD